MITQEHGVMLAGIIGKKYAVLDHYSACEVNGVEVFANGDVAARPTLKLTPKVACFVRELGHFEGATVEEVFAQIRKTINFIGKKPHCPQCGHEWNPEHDRCQSGGCDLGAKSYT